jgi:hypothetical protein
LSLGTSSELVPVVSVVTDIDLTMGAAKPNRGGMMEIPPELLAAKTLLEPTVLSRPGVVAVGFGFRQEGALIFEEPSIRVYVGDRSYTTADLPKEIAGFGVSIIEARFTPCIAPDLSRQNTIMGGVRIANPAIPLGLGGTLGAVVQDIDTGELLGLSCFHVVGPPGNVFPLTVWQPDHPPVGVIGSPPPPDDNIGHVVRVDFPQTVTPTFPPQLEGVVDAAVFSLAEARTHGRSFSRAILDQNPPALLVDRVTQSARAVVGQDVRKRGFQTRVKHGRVIATGINSPWTATGLPNALLIDQADILPISDPPFCEEGDSGSLVLDEHAPTAVGLLWGRNGGHGLMSEITTVESRLRIRVVWN